MNRRTFLSLPLDVLVQSAFAATAATARPRRSSQTNLASVGGPRFDLAALERARVVAAADRYLQQAPVTITATSSPRSAGGRHDFFSEADYWWPDPENPGGPYIQRDGMTNPGNFVEHRRAMVRLSLHVPALAAAWKLTRDRRYAAHAARHARAWFIDRATQMNPNLLYSQAIQGRVTGRGVGIIDTIHLVEVARALAVLDDSGALSAGDRSGIREWFSQYLTWMTTHQYGIDEREARNNHGTCWVMQVAEFARYTKNDSLTAFCRDRYKTVLVPNQVAADGSFPEELRRTKPYGYSLFNLEAVAGLCQFLSTGYDNLWSFTLPDGRGIRKAMEFLYPYLADKSKWPYKPDVQAWEGWPVRQPCLLFAGLAFTEPKYLELWKRLPPDPTNEEVQSNVALTQPLLWLK